MIKYDFTKKHTATQALQEVHSNMIERFSIEHNDVQKAKKMQNYLQYFKKVFSHPELYESNDETLQALGLDQQAIQLMRTRFQQILGVTSNYNQIFKSEHRWYKYRKDFDDIVEGELNALLQVIAEEATGTQNINLGQKIVGSDSATIDIDALGENLVDKLVDSFQNTISQKQATNIVENISAQARSGKIDVMGYNKNLIVSANINPKFEAFVDLFSGVNFSVKNYRSDNKYQIHLGHTNVFKAMYGSLTDLGYEADSALHIYSHSLMSYKKQKNIISRNNDIFHLRFMYELTGSGLVDSVTKKPLNSVDFLIYNDPISDKIFVKSTKKMVYDILNNKKMKITNPWSGIYVSKLSFD